MTPPDGTPRPGCVPRASAPPRPRDRSPREPRDARDSRGAGGRWTDRRRGRSLSTALTRAAAAVLASLLAACSGGGGGGGSAEALSYDLALELRDALALELALRGERLEARFVTAASHGLLVPGAAYQGRGEVEAFPEADATLYVARFDGPPVEGGPCGDAPVSLALSLFRRDDRTDASGSLSAFCGEGTFSGRPVRILRLESRPSTPAPAPEPEPEPEPGDGDGDGDGDRPGETAAATPS